MKKIESLLLGISILLITIIIHLAVSELLLTDFIAIVGIYIVFSTYISSNKKD